MSETPNQFDEAAARGKAAVDGAADGASKLAEGAGAAFEKIGDNLKNISAGTAIGMAVMGLLGWLGGTMFGGLGGIFSTVASGLLALGGAFLFGPQIGPKIDSWLSGVGRSVPPQGSAPSQGYGRSAQQPELTGQGFVDFVTQQLPDGREQPRGPRR